MPQGSENSENPYAPIELVHVARGPSLVAWLLYVSANVKACTLLYVFVPENGLALAIVFLACSLLFANALGGSALIPLSATPFTLAERLTILAITAILFSMLCSHPQSSLDPRVGLPSATAADPTNQQNRPVHAITPESEQ